ncbi:hypothetical protein D1007_62561 [Hordeum vulgare]|nr:hypothetical protein D1007_62561 [Hordeum vulgare]
MKLLCWNIRGFGLPGRRRQLVEYLRQEEIDIVGLQETIRQDFSLLELQRLSRHHFSWQWLPASGHSRGILLGVREETFLLEDMDQGEFFVSMAITDRRTHLSWEVIIVYGPADHARSAEFLAELKNKVDRCTTPVVVAGDFDLIRWASDKSSPNVDRPRVRLFNDYIADLALREIARVGARYTWSNKQGHHADWLRPYASALLVGGRLPPRSWRFCFESFWLDQPGFRELVRDRWHRAAASPPRVYCAVDIWHHCAKMARQAMKGWGANLGADLRARKGALLGQIKTLDDLADGTGLSPNDWIRRYSFDDELMGIFSSEELFWQRRGSQKWLLKGDANTAYFQAIANVRRRKCVIPFLRDGDALLESPEDISSHIYSFYKELFSADLRGGSSLCEDFWPLADQFWKSIQSIKHEIRLGLRISVGDGYGTQFWLDPWLEGELLRFRFPRLFAICADPAVLVSAAALAARWHIAFRRPLGPTEVLDWELLLAVIPLPTSVASDSISWSLSPSGAFSVSSAYLALCRMPILRGYPHSRRPRCP